MKGSALVGCALLVGVLSCAATRSQVCHPGEQAAVSDSLYFGTAKPDGVVTAEDWQAFVTSEVSPRLPQGLTSWQASGQWLSSDGDLQREQSYVLNVVHADTERYETAVHEIVERYRVQFRQEAVLRVRASVCMSH